MTLNELDAFFNSFLKKEDFAGDPSLNGIQIQNSAPDTLPVTKVAFAVDACEATAKAAVDAGAQVLVVHHGLFWGHCQTITGNFYSRVASFIKNDLALIAYHIPLDANNPYGNNFGLASAISSALPKAGFGDVETFGVWRGMDIGARGTFKTPVTPDELAAALSKITKTKCRALAFGKQQIRTVGIISGGASEDVEQAVELGLDCYITGEFQHEQYHFAEECGINVIAGGHYGTETMGVSLLKEKVEKELGLGTIFIDLPTDL